MPRTARTSTRPANVEPPVFAGRRRVSGAHKAADIEILARMAARLAGCDHDKHVRMKMGDVLAFDDLTWRYPDFLGRAEAAYAVLSGPLPSNP